MRLTLSVRSWQINKAVLSAVYGQRLEDENYIFTSLQFKKRCHK